MGEGLSSGQYLHPPSGYALRHPLPQCGRGKCGQRRWSIGVPDVYKTCERLAAVGVKIPRPAGPMAHGGSVIAFIEDPDGYRIELVERS